MKIYIRLELVTISKVLLIALLTLSVTILSAQDCIYTDFTYTIGANGEVTFKDISSSPTGISSWIWNFGDGAILSPTTQNPTHRYNISNTTDPSVCFDVTLTVSDGVNSGVSVPKHICIPTSTQSGGNNLYVKITSPVEIYDGACNKNFAKIIQGEQTSFEATVLGGTPPYSFVWTTNAVWRYPNSTASPSTLGGPGPHVVTFPFSTSNSCYPEQVSLEVTDARGIKSTSIVNVSIRGEVEGPGAIKITASKLPACEGEEVIFKVKPDNPFALSFNYINVSVAATYRWLIDGREFINSPLKRIPYTFPAGSAGVHEVRVEIHDGGATYYSAPLQVAVRTPALCNVIIPPVPDFELKVNDVVNGTLSLDANDLCTDKINQRITIKVPKSPIVIGSSPDCLPNYSFQMEIIPSDGIPRTFNNPCSISISDLTLGRADVITDALLRELGSRPPYNNPNYYIKDLGSYIEFTLPICFANCGPLLGCNQLRITTGRYAQSYPVANDPITSLYGSFNNTGCSCVFKEVYSIGVTNPNFYANTSNCSYIKPSTYYPLQGKIAELRTVVCAIKVKDNYPPLSISGINSVWNCSSRTYQFDITKISGGAPFELDPNSNFISCSTSDIYKKVKWKAYYFSNPNQEITDFVTASPLNNKIATVNGNHPYFSSFAPSERRLFIIEASVADADGNVAKYAEVVGFDPPLSITIAGEVNRCATANTPLSNIPVVVGGKLPYVYNWGVNNAYTFTPTSTTENPSLNLTGMTPVIINLTVIDDNGNGCIVSKEIKITPSSLKSISLGNRSVTACSNSSSVKTIGPINATTQRDLETYLEGSGDYSYRWTASTPDGLDKLSDPTIPYPTVSSDGNAAVTYTLVITDNLGGCTTSNSIDVIGLQTIFNVELGADKILCAGTGNIVTLTATTKQGGNIMNNALLDYQWSSDAPNFISNSTSNVLVLNNVPNGSRNTYTVTSIFKEYGCSQKDDIIVEIKKDWTYKGYESVIAPLLVGQKGPLWKSSDNEIFVASGTSGSGAVSPFNYVFLPSPPLGVSDIVDGNYGAIKQANYSGNGITVILRDNLGCSKDFPSNTYYKLSKNPTVLVSSNKQVVCSGGEICLYLTLNTNVVTGQEYLPRSFYLTYDVKQASLQTDGSWYYTPIANFIPKNIEFNLTDAALGIYTAITCTNVPSNANLTRYALLIDGGLPNSDVTGAGKFKVEYQFNASPSGPFRQNVTFFDPYILRGIPEEAFDYVALGATSQKYTLGNNAYAEYAASRNGEVRMVVDVDVQSSTRFFRAFIDPCILYGSGNIAQQGDESSLIIKNKENTSKGAFSVHPSPFANDITLNYEVRAEKGSYISIHVYNSLGQLIDKISENSFHPLGVFSTVYDTGKLTSGIYIFELTMDGEKFIRKSMKVD